MHFNKVLYIVPTLTLQFEYVPIYAAHKEITLLKA